MIVLKEKKDCCGCSACAQRCPKQCITMQSDNEGFLYPHIDTEKCIDCGLCEKVCPVINRNEPTEPIAAYAAINKNEEIRLASSSGGIFTLLAEAVINEGGVVFGVKFNESWQAVFDYTETLEGIAPFRGSKYVQAVVGNAYKYAESFLKYGRKVLFTGTPCQIAGLKKYLRKDYDNLLAVDVICHGAPSPLVWKEYVDELIRTKSFSNEKNAVPSLNDDSRLISFQFREKTKGWKKYHIQAAFSVCRSGKEIDDIIYIQELHSNNKFMQGFLRNIYLRPSCYSCPAKNGTSNSDITIGDFWGIDKHMPEMDDDKGTSAVLVKTKKGIEIFGTLNIHKKEILYNVVIAGNPALVYSVRCPNAKRRFFFTNLDVNVLDRITGSVRKTFIENTIAKLKSLCRILLKRILI